MEPRFFSVEEADKELSKIKETFDKIFHLNTRIKDISKDIQELVNIWGEEIFDGKHVDHELYMERVDKRANLIQDIQSDIDEVNKVGCVVKDVDIGLVDFFHKKGENVVFLCWRYGEPRITHWHPVNSGFSNRRPLEELATV